MYLKISFLFLFFISSTLSSYSQENKINKEPNQLESLPVYPRCKGKDIMKARKCMSKKITKLIKKNFNISLAKKLGLKPGKYEIKTSLIINKEGKVTGIKAGGTLPELEIEAIRVIYLIPKMTPGKHQGKNINVSYSIPIRFEIK